MATMKGCVKKSFRKFFKKICCCCRSSSDDDDTYAVTSLGSPATVRKGSALSSLVGSRSSESVFQSCNTNLTSTSKEASIDGHKENDLTEANVLIGGAGKDDEEASSSDESNADHLTKANVLLGGAGENGEEASSSSSDESNADHPNKEEAKAKRVQRAEGDTISSIVVKDKASTSDVKGLEIQHSTVPSAVSSTTGRHKPNAGDEDSIPSSEFITPATDNLVLTWQEDLREGAGLSNLGNTCFVNASLQGLTYTAPLANFLLYSDHSLTCKQTEFCMMCLLEKHVFNTFMNRGMAINPIDIVRNFKHIGEDLCFGRQEDAHVFLSYVIDSLHQSCLFNQSQLNINVETPTLIHQIFRGYLKSRVECTQCFSISDKLDSCLDISLNINKSLDLVKAFYEFTKTENLTEYRCGMCSHVGKSTKRVSLHVAPNVLIVTIKRYDEFGHKIAEEFLFPEKLDIRPFMSNQVVHEPELYSLYSVIVHHGTTTNSGHYYSYNKVSNGSWFRMDDADVEPVTNSEVLEDQAYILFYMRSPEQNAIPVDIEDPQSSNWVASRTQRKLPSVRTTQRRTLKEERRRAGDALHTRTRAP